MDLDIRRSVREFFKKGDVVLLVLCTVASVIGLVLIYSATRFSPDKYGTCPQKQAVFILLGIVAYVMVTFIDVEFLLEKWWRVFLGLGVAVILLIVPFGRTVGGNRSWVYFPGVPIGFQPGELAKLAYIVVLAWLLNHERTLGVSRVAAIAKYLILTGLYAGLLAYLSSDWGMVLVFLFMFVIMAWVAGVSKWWFIGVGIPAASALLVLWSFVLPLTKYWTDYRIMRFRVVFDHSLDPRGIGWNQARSILAIASGELTGMGFLQGRQTQSVREENLPARWTDFIFSVCGEEFGMIGCCVILVLLFAIIVRCIWVSRRAKSHMSAYIAMGIAGMLMIQTVLNVGMCLYVVPVVGLTLPFISYGGTSVLTLFIAMGVVSSIKMRPMPSWLKDRNHI